MFLDQYNSLMSDMLNKRHALAKLRAELEGREGRLCRHCGRFRHLIQKYRSEEKQKKKIVIGNKFKVLGSHVMQCGVRELRRQKIAREKVKYFECGEERHKKWECPNMRKKKQEKVALPRKVWEKVKRHSRVRELLPRKAAMCIEGWTTRREMVIFVEYRRYDYKGTKAKENRGQGFL